MKNDDLCYRFRAKCALDRCHRPNADAAIIQGGGSANVLPSVSSLH